MMILWQLFKFSNKNHKEEFLPHAEKPKPLSSVINKTLWDWGELLIVPFLLGIMTLSWNYRVDQQASHNYRAQLVRNYIDSITELILDQYHHGKIAKYPEISVEEVEAFVRAKTVNTLQALNSPNHNPSQFLSIGLENLMKFIILSPSENTPKQNLINFLGEAGIGFLPPDKYEGYNSRLLIQNICPLEDVNAENYMFSEEKDITFHDFLCKIELPNVVLNELHLKAVIWEGANLYNAQMKGAILEQADFQRAFLNKVDLTGANLTKANFKGAYLHEANLQDTVLNQANLRGARLDKPLLVKGESEPKPTNLENAQFKGVNLRGAFLQKVNFKNAIMEPFCVFMPDKEEENSGCESEIATNLRNAKLQGANLQGTKLIKANLREADLTDAKINITTTNLERALYDENTKFPSKFVNYTAKFVNHREIMQKQMIKIHCNLGKDKQELEKLQKSGLSDMDLRDACLENAWFKDVDLSRADLRGADMFNMYENALKYAILKDTLYDDKTKLPSTIFGLDKKAQDTKARELGMIKLSPGANLEGKDIRYADLSGFDLSNAKLQRARLSNIDFDYKTKWEGAEFDLNTELPFDKNTAIDYGMRFAPLDINWEGENHQKENLQNAILRRGNLKHTILKQAQLQKADLTGADLTGADLTGANLRKAILTNATLEEVDLTDANLRGAKLSEAILEDPEQELKNVILCRTALPIEVKREFRETTKDRDCLKTQKSLTVDDLNRLVRNK